MEGLRVITFPNNSDQRFQEWLVSFNGEWDRCASCNLNVQHVIEDPNDVYLKDANDELKEWTQKLESYNSIHKTDLFYDFQDSKSKLLIKLDHIDVTNKPERRRERLKIYDSITALTKQLEARIHPNHSDFEVSGNSLQFNREALSRINGPGLDNIPVVVLSVVGQPKSRKTSLMNSLLQQFGNSFPVPTNIFPLSSEDDPKYSDLKGQEGILLWTCPELVTRDGTTSAWFFLDIWMEYPRVAVYNKLIDFCLSTSSTVLFSEPCNPHPDIYWQPSDSTLESTIRKFCNALQLHFFLQTDETAPYQITEVSPDELAPCTEEFRKKLTSVIDISRFLKARCKCITSTLIRSDNINSNSDENKLSNLITQKALDKVLTHCSTRPLEINNVAIRTGNFSECVGHSIDLILGNDNYTQPQQSDVNNIIGGTDELTLAIFLQNMTVSTPNYDHDRKEHAVSKHDDTISPMDESSPETLVENKVPGESLTKSEVNLEIESNNETKNLLSKMSKDYFGNFKIPFQTLGEMRRYFEEAELLSHHKSISQDIIQKYGDRDGSSNLKSVIESKLAEWLQVIQDFNNKRKDLDTVTQVTNKKLDTILEEIAEELQQILSQNPSRFTFSYYPEYFQTVYEKIADGLPDFCKKKSHHIIMSSCNNLQQFMNSMKALVNTYVTNFQMLYKEYICIQSNQFEKCHQEILSKAKSSTKYKDSGRKQLDGVCDQVIEYYKKQFQSQNSCVYGQEERIAKKAHDHVIEKFGDFMESKISSATLTELQLTQVHHLGAEKILTLFLRQLRGHPTEPWINNHSSLKQSLKDLLVKYKQKNQTHLKKVALAKKEGFNAGKNNYQEIMERSLPNTKVSVGVLSGYDKTASAQAILTLKEKLTHVHPIISSPWLEEFKVILDELKQGYINDNQSKQEELVPSSAVFLPEIVEVHQQPAGHPLTEHYGIGLYISPRKVCVGVYVQQNVNFADNVSSCEPPMIAFRAGRVLIGEDANQDVNKEHRYNIFSDLLQHEDFEMIDVYIHGIRTKLGREEILSIFFHRIRMNAELILGQRVNSCYVVTTGMLTCGAKQMLKVSLSFAGFHKNTIIPCTTAMAISYVLKSKSNLKKGNRDGTNSRHLIVLCYATSSTVEIASADVTSGQVLMQTLSGDIYIHRRFQDSAVQKLKNIFLDQTKLESRIQHILKVAVPSEVSYNGVITCYEDGISQPLGQALLSQLATFRHLKSITTADLMDNIVRVAAALDAIRNQHPDLSASKVQFPTYNNISPYKINVKVDKKVLNFTYFNSCTSISQNFPLGNFEHVDIIVWERGRDSQNEWTAATYELKVAGQQATEFVLAQNEEANLTASTKPKGLSIRTRSKSLVGSECQRISEAIKPLLLAEQNIYGIKLKVVSTQPEQTRKVSDVGNRSCSNEDVLRDLKNLVKEVKMKLDNSKTTTTGVKKDITDRITKCEKLMNSADVKTKQLEMEKRYLEKAVKLIKP
ncbi:unnamed protein product [Allacma fusca]|uniref:Uncharacterized protein n=1 Tax=Allacma fusca TaxID=39272 RepID=A0A8J2J454_9HEXA|nr:unnamed protein product [Allacma fusca]